MSYQGSCLSVAVLRSCRRFFPAHPLHAMTRSIAPSGQNSGRELGGKYLGIREESYVLVRMRYAV